MKKFGFIMGAVLLAAGFLYRLGKEELYYGPYDRRNL